MEDSGVKDSKINITKRDLEYIKSLAINFYNNHDARPFNMNDDQFRTYCYVHAVQSWLRSKDVLKIIVD
jgi:hypothetical protein